MAPKEKPFVNRETTVKLNNGDSIQLPRLTLGKILAVTDSMDKLISVAKEKAPQVFALISGIGEKNASQVGMEVLESLPALFPIVMKELIQVISDYTGAEKSYVENELDLEDLVAIATPFFANILAQGNHLVAPLSQMFKAAKSSPESLPT